jgi:hemoglobin/transferrin/lactoferrin receptor protein
MKTISLALACITGLCNSIFSQAVNDSIRSIDLQQYVISASRDYEPEKNVSQQIHVISATRLKNLQVQTTADALASTPGVFVQKSQMGGGSPVIRGFEASRILLVVDGVRMNNLIYRSGHLQNVITADNFALERIEVLSGPASSVYGTDALGGVVHIITCSPKFSETEKLQITSAIASRYSSANTEKTLHGDFNLGWKNFSSFSSFTRSDFSDLRGGRAINPFYGKAYGERNVYVERINNKDSLMANPDPALQKGSAYTQYDVVQKFALRTGSLGMHKLNLQYSTSSDVPRYDRLTDPTATGLKFAEWYYGPQKRLLAAYNYSQDLKRGYFNRIKAGINFQDIEESRITRSFNNPARTSRIENVQVAGAFSEILHETEKHAIRLGADAQWNNLQSTASVFNINEGTSEPANTRYPDGDNTMLNLGVYALHGWNVTKDLRLNSSARVGYSMLHSTIVDTSFFRLPYTSIKQNVPVFSASTGLVKQIKENATLRLGVSSGYRVPNVDDLSKIFESAPGRIIVPNAAIKPELTVSPELGFTYRNEKGLTWENTTYYTRFMNAIVVSPFRWNEADSILYNGETSAVYAPQNRQKAFIWGINSYLRLEPVEHFTLAAGVNYTYGRIENDSANMPLDHIPPLNARLEMGYTTERLHAGLFMVYNGWKRIVDYNLGGEDNEQYATPDGMPAWYTLNLRLSYKVASWLTLQGGIDNLLDTQYRTFSSGINAPGRNFMVTLRICK